MRKKIKNFILGNAAIIPKFPTYARHQTQRAKTAKGNEEDVDDQII